MLCSHSLREGDRRRPLEHAGAVVVAPAEGDGAAIAKIAVKLEWSEWQVGDQRDECAFFCQGDYLLIISEARRHARRRPEKLGLLSRGLRHLLEIGVGRRFG